jgi:lipopolysaccharide transport system ATP-binding protein
MSSSIAITVSGLGKRYLIGHQGPREKYTALRDVIARNLRGVARSVRDVVRGRQIIQADEVEEFWALKDVSFGIKEGEAVGIIGRNGAGKSTLLKLLSRITEPTTGRIEINGRVASLLEVGTGFHPELTGRENIYLNGAILGMTRAEIKNRFDEIVAFSEVEKFLDTPVKRYSSGMYMRLAFAVAAHLETEILIVDEVLAVGDAAFQKKCLGKMQSVAGLGRTILFVSHNISSIRQLCSNAIVFEKGQLLANCPVEDAITLYLGTGSSLSDVTFVPKAEKPSITRISVNQEELLQGNLQIDVSYESPFMLSPPAPGITLTSTSGIAVFGSNPRFHPVINGPTSSRKGVARLSVTNLPIEPGTYFLSVWLGDWHRDYDSKVDALTIVFKDGNRPALRPSPEINGYLMWPGSWHIVAEA